MAMKESGRASRLWIALNVGFTTLLALVALGLLTWLSERPGLRLRFDLTAERANTLDPVSQRVVDELPGTVAVDLFFRPDTFPFAETSAEIHDRTRRLLLIARESSGGKIEVEDHDLAQRAAGGGRWEQRAQELGLDAVRPPGVLVVSYQGRKHVLHARGDLAEVDPGNPHPNQFVPAHVTSFRGEEQLVSALLKVTQGERAHVYFATGRRRADVYGTDENDLGRLFNALVDDGFDVDRWHGETKPPEQGGGPVPDDCAVLALIGPRAPYTDIEADWIREYLARGGRVVAAPSPLARERPNSLEALLAEQGIGVRQGLVARPIPSPTTGQPTFGDPRCSAWYVGPSGMRPPHAITTPLRLGERNAFLVQSRALERRTPPAGTQVLELLHGDEHTWLDFPGPTGLYSWVRDPGEEHGPFVVGMAAVFPSRLDPVGPLPVDERVGGRLVVLGSQLAFASADAIFPTNRDLLLNAFNWAASREFRVRVSTRDPIERRLDLFDGGVRLRLALVCFIVLPGLLFIGGVVTAWRRFRT